MLGRTYICRSCGLEKGTLQFGIPAGSRMKSTA
jgi:hypothetical protein